MGCSQKHMAKLSSVRRPALGLRCVPKTSTGGCGADRVAARGVQTPCCRLAIDGSDLDAAIIAFEALYRAQGTRSYFQVSSASTPASLDTISPPAVIRSRSHAY